MTGRTHTAWLMASLLLGIAVGAARADSVKIGGFWIDGISVQEIADGKLIYLARDGSERVHSLATLQGLKLDGNPALLAGNEAMDAGRPKDAVASFRTAASAARQPWARHWALWRAAAAADEAGLAVDALEAYGQLVREKAQPFFLVSAPLNALKAAPVDQHRDLAQRIELLQRPAARTAAEEPVRMMQQLLKMQQDGGGAPTTVMPDVGEFSGSPQPSVVELALPSALERTDDATRMLLAGHYRDALTDLDRRLALKEPRLAMRLYQRGLAQMKLAEAAEDPRLFMDAGLSFMRVVVYFGRSSYKGAALLEAGYIHDRLGRRDLAVKLWRKARVELDPDAEPALVDRLESLMRGSVDDTTGNDES